METALTLRLSAAIGAALLAAWPALGQIEVVQQVVPKHAVLYEPIKARVVIRNNTGGVLNFDAGREPARFFFEVEFGKNEAVRQTDRSPLLFGVKIVPFETRTNEFNLTELYSMRALGVYKVSACLEWQDKLFVSAPIEIEIRRGFEMVRLVAGVPGESSVLRAYILEYLSKDDGENVYLRIEDEQARTIYGMFNLGRIVRVRKPELKVDESGNVHVLFQTMSMDFVHTAFTPYGVQLFSRTYTDKSGSIALVNLPNGQISVSLPQSEGGAARGAGPPGLPPLESLPKKLSSELFGTKPE